MDSFRRISIDQAHAFITESNPVILDVRDAHAFQTAAIAGAVHLSNDNIQGFLADTARDRPLLVYCYHGNSSQSAAQFLIEQGFAQVLSIEGGFEAWRQVYPVS